MAEPTNIEQRRISGTGVLRIPEDDRTYRKYYLYGDIIRLPITPYLNRYWEPERGFLAHITLMNNGYVVDAFDMDFKNQLWTFTPDLTGQNLITLKCVYLGILESFVNLGTALNLSLPTVVNTVADYSHLPLDFNEIHFKVYRDAAIQFTLRAIPYDICQGDYDNPVVPPNQPELPDSVPQLEPTDISPPYDNDDITSPAAIDVVPEEPPVEGTWLLTWNTGIGGSASGTYPGLSTDTFAIVAGASTNCNLTGNSALIKNGSILLENPFNCNPNGFVSVISSAVFTPSP